MPAYLPRNSSPFATDMKLFAKEFESLLELIEECQHADMAQYIAQMKHVRTPWIFPDQKTEITLESQVFTALNGAIVHAVLSHAEKPMDELMFALRVHSALLALRRVTKKESQLYRDIHLIEEELRHETEILWDKTHPDIS